MNVGCSGVCWAKNWETDECGIVALECYKGRGIILPGGSFEPEQDESLHAAADREFLEETGVPAKAKKFIFSGGWINGFHIYTYLMDHGDSTDFKWGEDVGSGKIVLAQWDDLFSSDFGPYYRLVRTHLEFLRHIPTWEANPLFNR